MFAAEPPALASRASGGEARLDPWLVALLALALTLPALGQGSLVTDEALYAALAREALEGGRWFCLTLQGNPYANKPPAGFWAMAASFEVFGVSTWSARLPSALSGAFVCGVVAWATQRAYGRTSGLLAGAALAITPAWMEVAAEARLETPALAAGLLGVLLCVRTRERGDSRSPEGATGAAEAALAQNPFRSGWQVALAGLSFGVAALVKGPVVLPPLALGVALLRSNFARLALLGIAGLVTASWPLMLHFVGGEIWTRAASSELRAHIGPSGRDPVALLRALFRALFVAGAPLSWLVLALFRRAWNTNPRVAYGAAIWVTVVSIGAALPAPTYSRYIIPLLPALVLVVGGGAAALGVQDPSSVAARGRMLRWILVVAALLAAAPPWLFGVRYHRDPARFFRIHQAVLATEFPAGQPLTLVGDDRAAERGTIALYLRRDVDLTDTATLAGLEPSSRPRSILLMNAEGAVLRELGYEVRAADGKWTLLAR